MYNKILIPLDGSLLSEKAIPHALSLLSPESPHITLVCNARANDAEAIALLKRASDHIDDVVVETQLIQGKVAESILRAAGHERDAGLIAMSTHGRTGLERFAFGSVAERVLHLAQRPILLVPAFASEDPEVKRILLPLDGSDLSRQALPYAHAVAKQTSAPLLLLLVLEQYSVWEWGEYMRGGEPTKTADADIIGAAERYLNGIRVTMPDIACEVKLAPARPVDAITSAVSEEKCDLIVMNTHGRSGYKRWRYGSTAEAVLHNVKVPLLLIRGQDPAQS